MFTGTLLVVAKNWKVTSINKWVDDQIAVYSYHVMLVRNKKEQTNDTRDNTNEFQNRYAEWTKPDVIEYI